jgi:uncharacterized iron-regulated protein
MRRYLGTLLLSVVLGGAIAAAMHGAGAATQSGEPAPASQCPGDGIWREPGRTPDVPPTTVIDALGAADVVLLGELHATPSHHAWHAAVIAALAQKNRPVVIGLEALPREAQGALDAFVAGDIDEAQFLEQARWSQTWGYPFTLYRPVFALARAQRIPMVAMNVDRRWTRNVARQGLDAARAEPGFPVGKPADPPVAYVDSLADHFTGHGGASGGMSAANFVAAQLVWDRAMAEAIAKVRAETPGARVVALMGLGHLEYGWGVPHQLSALGQTSVATAAPVDAGGDCAAVGRDYANFIIGLSPGNGPK